MRKIVFFLMLFFLIGFSAKAELIEGTLSNALTYRIYPKKGLPLVCVNIKIKAGSIFDKKSKFGEAYLTAKSLENCDTKHLSYDELKEKFDEAGIVSGISVSKGFITISAVVEKSKLDRMMCLLSEILKSRFDKKNFEEVKTEAINSKKALLNDKDYLAIHAAFVGLIRQKSISHSSIGTIEGLKATTAKDAKAFADKFFRSNNMVISVSGDVDKNIVDKIRLYFSFLKPAKNIVTFEKPQFNDFSVVKDIIKPTQQSYIYIAFPSVGCCKKEYYVAKVLSYLLAGNLDAFLPHDIRTLHGYAYSVFAFNYPLPEGGVFVIGLQTQNKFTLDAIDRIFKDIKAFDKYITPKKVETAKEFFINSKYISLQTPQSIAAALSDSYMRGVKDLPWVYATKMINSVSYQDVRDFAKKLFEGHVSIGVVSEKDYSDKIKAILKKYGYR